MEARRVLVDTGSPQEVFVNLEMMLNPSKCIFGVTLRKFLDFMIASSGIDANPKKSTAIMNMKELKTIHDLQSFNCNIASMIRFLSKSAEISK